MEISKKIDITTEYLADYLYLKIVINSLVMILNL